MAAKKALSDEQIIELALTKPNMLLGEKIEVDCSYCERKHQKIYDIANQPGINSIRIASKCACGATGHSHVRYYNGGWYYSGIYLWFSPDYIKILDKYLARPEVRKNIRTVKKYLAKHIGAKNK